MKKVFFTICLLTFAFCGYGQREKGRILKAPKIFQKDTKQQIETVTTSTSPATSEPEIEFQFEEQPRLRFSSSFESKTDKTELMKSDVNAAKALNGDDLPFRLEPIREVNKMVEDDTSSIDEGELQIVEIEDYITFDDPSEMVKVASYYSIWDTRTVDPYGIDPKDFEDVIPIKLYDLNEGRYWNTPLDRTPITSHFGYRRNRWHVGTDIDLETGDPVYSTFDGIVRVAGGHSGWGNTVLVRHYNGLETLYGHLSKILVEPNTLVKAGDKIGLGGNTGRSSGSHLHIEVRYEGNAFDSENIFRYSGAANGTEILTQELLLDRSYYNYLRGGKSRVAIDFESSEDDAPEPQQLTQKVWIRVKRGDTLTAIASRNRTTVGDICQLNRIRANQALQIGMSLRIQ
ncbi:MAG: peptidoglycan DD-metalloendopeptidase family protein [Spirosomaceae bacterium]|nr:peptidoglycan DD-metalloendopeptidase family protein [Spirosomataceae bacterium]